MGVGYVIGPRIAGTMVAGGVLSWLVLLPLLSLLGAAITTPFPPIHPNFANNPATGQPFLLSEMSPAKSGAPHPLHRRRRVLAAGLITLAARCRRSSRRPRRLEGLRHATGGTQTRTERDIPMMVVLVGSLLLAIFLAVMPGLPTQGNVLVSVLIIFFGFFFATVSSRITGLIGSSSNPFRG